MKLHDQIAEIYWLRLVVDKLRDQFQFKGPSKESSPTLSSFTKAILDQSFGQQIDSQSEYLSHKEADLFSKELEVSKIMIAQGRKSGTFSTDDRYNRNTKITLHYLFKSGILEIKKHEGI